MADKKQNIQRKGLLQYNDDVRSEMLRFNYWEDKTYTQLGGNYVRYAMQGRKANEVKANFPVYSGLSLYEYTTDLSSEYGKDINKKYLNPKLKHRKYEYEPVINNISSLEGEYQDTFNSENKLQMVGDLKYNELMSIGHYANSDRFLKEKYLTPSLVHLYGSSLKIEGNQDYLTTSVFNHVGGVYKHDTGRFNDLSINEGIRFGSIERLQYLTDNGGVYFLNKMFDDAKKINESLNIGEYVSRYDVRNINDTIYSRYSLSDPEFPFIKGKSNSLRYGGPTGHFEYDESDVYSEEITDFYNGSNETYAFSLGEDEKNNEGSNYYYSYSASKDEKGLLGKTIKLFNRHKISTLVGRFHTSVGDNRTEFESSSAIHDEITDTPEFTDTAKSKVYGNSHGRNLLKLDANMQDNNTNGYDNPYCRVWTYHHQYDSYKKTIRPFTDEEGPISVRELQSMVSGTSSGKAFRSVGDDYNANGGQYLANHTVLGDNGVVNIAPSWKANKTVTDCMFSIENLAWKDVPKVKDYLSREQIGPNGGRIMWFPPYDLDFRESVNVDWDENAFIGRGEKVYTYKDTNRNGSLSFTLLIDHPSIINDMKYRTGEGADKDPEADILRFFAGCQPPNPNSYCNFNDENDELDIKVPDTKGIPEKLVPPVENSSKKIIFYVYFPNNYSGYFREREKRNWKGHDPSDNDWVFYFLMGNGYDNMIATPEDGRVQRIGYEFSNSSDQGISVEMLSRATEGVIDGIYPNDYTRECYQWVKRTDKMDKNYKDPNGDIFTHGYYYRTDFDLNQKLVYNSNYADTASFGLNSFTKMNGRSDATCSFTDFLSACSSEITDDGIKQSASSEMSDDIYDRVTFMHSSEEMEYIINTTKDLQEKIVSVDVKGCATEQDSYARNGCEYTNSGLLARRRANSVMQLIKQLFANRAEEIEYNDATKDVIIEGKLKDMTSINTLEAKKQRYVRVEITLNSPDTKKVSETANGVVDEGGDSGMTAYSENNEVNHEYVTFDEFLDAIGHGGSVTGSYNSDIKTRYESESEYFERLKDTDPLVFKAITDKYKYFDPAFHSMSPEGFNARLTFLHQCTRQGHTIEPKDRNGYARAAGNLAFGRMPVCVLRIGDFINTKVLIRSVNIDYKNGNGIQWDLNPEGIGVQPMMAKVNLDIVILGGQSLNAPISRLQNALTFNYYANTGVYDDRSDRVHLKYDKYGNKNGLSTEEYTRLWRPYSDSEENAKSTK